jgi:hypothetical protein
MNESNWDYWDHDRFSPLAIAGMVVAAIAIAIAFAFVFGFVVMLLWNWLMPAIFNLPTIGYWQAWGLVLLSHLLIKGGWRGPSGHGSRRHARKYGKRFWGGHDVRDVGEDESGWCEECSSCDYSSRCRPFARGWIRTADGWKRDESRVRKDFPGTPKEGE